MSVSPVSICLPLNEVAGTEGKPVARGSIRVIPPRPRGTGDALACYRTPYVAPRADASPQCGSNLDRTLRNINKPYVRWFLSRSRLFGKEPNLRLSCNNPRHKTALPPACARPGRHPIT